MSQRPTNDTPDDHDADADAFGDRYNDRVDPPPDAVGFAGTPRMFRGGDAYVASNAVVVDRVTLGAGANIWFGCVLRGDDGVIAIGPRSNIQDLTMVHPDPGVEMRIGADVTVGHRCILHGSSIGDRAQIGMGAILLKGSEIGEESIVAAGAVVPEDAKIPPRSLVMGIPGKVKRAVRDDEIAMLIERAAAYVRHAELWLSGSGVVADPMDHWRGATR
jgi:carbonic anhydrase/acetyltransferase-like protein (isoleucine patch superfamily)